MINTNRDIDNPMICDQFGAANMLSWIMDMICKVYVDDGIPNKFALFAGYLNY